MQGDRTRPFQPKKAGGEAGGTSPPYDLPTEGGVFHRKVVKGAGNLTRPQESAAGGGDFADGALRSFANLTLSLSPAGSRQSARIRRS
jgi:hypothetical protein